MKVMVLGGSGNISTSIVKLLVEHNHEVVCYNRGMNKGEGTPDVVRQIHGDRQKRDEFEKMMQEENPDAVIDMICFGAEDAESDLRAFPNVKRLIVCSTVCVFGTYMTSFPVMADDERRPTSEYGSGKRDVEDVLNRAIEENLIPITMIRPSSTYGNQSGLFGSVGPNHSWIERIQEGKPIFVCGSGNNLHQFMHVSDMAKAFVMILENDIAIGKTYNVVSETTTDWNHYSKLAMKIIGKEVPVIGVPLDLLEALGEENFGHACPIFAFNSYFDNSLLKRDFPEFKQDVSLEDGMRQVIAWNQENKPEKVAYNEELFDKLAEGMLGLRNLL
ncbi:MAG: NAD-dependent epimerase/dehydratase family protein [Eubacteriales bacterium]